MIIKGQARGRSRQLAGHLLRQDQNEDIRLYELRGVVATDVPGALLEMEALTASVASKRPLYHASISPEAKTPLSDEQVRVAADTLERKLGLTGQPRVAVVHRKKDREHLHIVWSRIDMDRQRVISDSWNYRHHEEAARELEAAFGHRAIAGAHTPQVSVRRPRCAPEDYEYRQAERSGITPANVSAELAALWQASADAQVFRKKLEEAGYTLARGDRRVFVVIDRAGNVHSLARRLGMRSRDLNARLAGLDLAALPSVAETRSTMQTFESRKILRSTYRAAAHETALPASQHALPAARHRLLPRRAAVATITDAAAWINLPAHNAGVIRQVTTRSVAPRTSRFHALCAIVLAEYASKLDTAFQKLTGDALSAAIARLESEREAAIRRLAEDELDQPKLLVHGARYLWRGKTRRGRRFRIHRRVLRQIGRGPSSAAEARGIK